MYTILHMAHCTRPPHAITPYKRSSHSTAAQGQSDTRHPRPRARVEEGEGARDQSDQPRSALSLYALPPCTHMPASPRASARAQREKKLCERLSELTQDTLVARPFTSSHSLGWRRFTGNRSAFAALACFAGTTREQIRRLRSLASLAVQLGRGRGLCGRRLRQHRRQAHRGRRPDRLCSVDSSYYVCHVGRGQCFRALREAPRKNGRAGAGLPSERRLESVGARAQARPMRLRPARGLSGRVTARRRHHPRPQHLQS